MQVLEIQTGLVPFFELKAHLKAKQKKWKAEAKAMPKDAKAREYRTALEGRNWVTKTTYRYLETTVGEAGSYSRTIKR